MKEWFSAAELSFFALPGWPKSRFGIQKRCVAEGRESREIVARRGGKGGVCVEYRLTVNELAWLAQQQAVNAAPALPVLSAVADGVLMAHEPSAELARVTTHLADWQRQCAMARLILVREVERRVCGGLKKTRALESVVGDAAAGRLPESVQGVVLIANARAGADRAISRRSLFEWVGLVEQAEQLNASAVALLAPKPRVQKIPDWAGALLKMWGQPSKPNLTAVLEVLPQSLPVGVSCPSYSQAYRFIHEQLGSVERERGRMGSRDLRNIQPFVRRDTSILAATDIYTADGHTFDAEVAHPMHGKPFRPEITTIMDVATRRVVGWSVDLAESGWAVLDALRMAVCEYGIPSMFYVDNGSGYVNKMMQGLMAQLSIEMTHSIPYNSQARGIIERSHQTLWVQAAKKLPTYMGADMDAQARQRAFKVTRADVKAQRQSRILMDFRLFVQFVTDVVADYNARPHSSLGKFTDAVTLKKRSYSPVEFWQKSVQLGAKIVPVEVWERDDLFLPFVMRMVRRGEVEVFGNKYFSRDLEQHHGDTVQVHYDIHDAETVVLRDHASGRLICRAAWNGNKSSYFPLAVVEQNQQKRAEGRLRRLAVKQAEALAELSPTQVLAHVQAQSLPNVAPLDLGRVFADLEARAASENGVVRHPLPSPPPQSGKERGMGGLYVVGDAPETKLARWLRIDEEWMSTNMIVDAEERTFWRLFQQSKAFAAMREADELLKRRLVETAYLQREQF